VTTAVLTERTVPFAPVPDGAEPPEETARRVTVDGLTVHARCWVESQVHRDPPVVLVHGLGVASRMCQPVARHLAHRFTVYAPDLPGFGESDHPDGVPNVPGLAASLAGWSRAMGIGPVIVAGTSVGSQVAAEFARRHPRLVQAVVLASPTVDADRRRWRSQLPRWQVEQSTQSMRMRSLQLRDYAKCGIRRVIRTFSAALDHRIEDTVAEIEHPVLVCWGSRDPLVSRGWAASVADRAPDGELRVLPGALHALSHENPLEMGRAISHFATMRLGRPGSA
jgi:pimeloyl-ACP methyl ester carboxylesterase